MMDCSRVDCPMALVIASFDATTGKMRGLTKEVEDSSQALIKTDLARWRVFWRSNRYFSTVVVDQLFRK